VDRDGDKGLVFPKNPEPFKNKCPSNYTPLWRPGRGKSSPGGPCTCSPQPGGKRRIHRQEHRRPPCRPGGLPKLEIHQTGYTQKLGSAVSSAGRNIPNPFFRWVAVNKNFSIPRLGLAGLPPDKGNGPNGEAERPGRRVCKKEIRNRPQGPPAGGGGGGGAGARWPPMMHQHEAVRGPGPAEIRTAGTDGFGRPGGERVRRKPVPKTGPPRGCCRLLDDPASVVGITHWCLPSLFAQALIG